MRKTEKNRLIKKYNEIIEAIRDMEIPEYVFDCFSLSDELENDDDNETVLAVIDNFEIDELYWDIDTAISDLQKKLGDLEKLRNTKVKELYRFYNNYAG